MAEREGFEPPIQLPVRRISSAVLSTTQPPLRGVPIRGSGRRLRGAPPIAWGSGGDQGRKRPLPRPRLSAGYFDFFSRGGDRARGAQSSFAFRSRVNIVRASRRGGRVVEGARLESVYAGNRIAGSNPAPSASRRKSLRGRPARSVSPLYACPARIWRRAFSSSPIGAGLVRCRSKPASSARRRSSSCPCPVSATRNNRRPCSRARMRRAVS